LDPIQELSDVLHFERQDVAVCMSGEIARSTSILKSGGVSVILQLHDLLFDTLGGTLLDFRRINSVAVSSFVAER
jgi:hypothetical protein